MKPKSGYSRLFTSSFPRVPERCQLQACAAVTENVFVLRGVLLQRPDGALFLNSLMLEAENWKIVFEVYEGHPISALTLAYQLIAIKQSLQRGRKGISDAIAGLELAIEGLYPHTDFHKMAHKFYHRTIEGNLKPQQEEKLRELGVKL